MVDLSPGDIILAVDGVSTSNMMHCEAQNRMKHATRQLSLTIQRSEAMIQMTPLCHERKQIGESTICFCYRPETKLWSPQVKEDSRAHPFKMNLEAERQVSAMLITTGIVFVLALLSTYYATMMSVFNFTW